jgi:hypothetical protein
MMRKREERREERGERREERRERREEISHSSRDVLNSHLNYNLTSKISERGERRSKSAFLDLCISAFMLIQHTKKSV